jgi:ribosomal protein L21E
MKLGSVVKIKIDFHKAASWQARALNGQTGVVVKRLANAPERYGVRLANGKVVAVYADEM